MTSGYEPPQGSYPPPGQPQRQPQPWPPAGQPWQQPGAPAQGQSQAWPARTPQQPRPLVNPDEARAVIEARRELGPDMEQALVESFTERVEQALLHRGSLDEQERLRHLEALKADSRNQMVLGIVSLALAIPLTAISGGIVGLTGIVVVWIAVVLVNMAYAMRKGRRE